MLEFLSAENTLLAATATVGSALGEDTALVLLKQLSGIPQWLTQRTKDCHTPNSKLETLMPV